MNDQPDDTTQVTPAPEPAPQTQPAAAAQPELEAAEHSPSAAQWRRVAIVTSALFVGTLGLLGWQMSSGNDPSLASQQVNGVRGPGMQGQAPGQQGGAPPMNGEAPEGGWGPGDNDSQGGSGTQKQDGQSQGGQQSPQGPPTTGPS